MKIDALDAPRTMKENIYQALRSLIISGEIPPGARLVEAELAREFGTSKTPVREALLMLERDRWIRIVPHGGAQVNDLSSAEFREWLLILDALEFAAAREMLRNVRSKDWQDNGDWQNHAQHLLEEMTISCESLDWGAYREHQRRLHEFLWSPVRLPTVLSMIGSIHAMLDRYFYAVIADDIGMWRRDLQVNVARVEAIRKGDLDGLIREVQDWHEIVVRHADE